MKIILLSDPHVVEFASDVCQGVYTQKAFQAVLPYLISEKPDLILLTGDLAAHVESERIYQIFFAELSRLGLPWRACKGNHDRGKIMEKIFGEHFLKDWECFLEMDYFSLWHLDSSAESPPLNLLNQLKQLLRSSSRSVILFTHYPPLKVNNPIFDDVYPLLWRAELWDALQGSQVPVHVFFGHIHFSFDHTISNLMFHSIPSTTLPIMAHSHDFDIDLRGPYFRILELHQNQLTTQVKQLGFLKQFLKH